MGNGLRNLLLAGALIVSPGQAVSDLAQEVVPGQTPPVLISGFSPALSHPTDALLTGVFAADFGDGSLVARGAIWRFLDDGSALGTAWREPDYDDRAWPVGPAPLGFGHAATATFLNQTNRFGGTNITFYFRHRFEVPDPLAWANLVVRLLRDDGGVVYLNGTEIFRSNLPDGPIAAGTLAVQRVDTPQDAQFYATRVSPGLLVAGANLLAVEIHQVLPTSSDAAFDLELVPDVPSTPPSVTLTDPLDQTMLSAPVTLSLAAAATDYDGLVSAVDFYSGSTWLGRDVLEPFSLTLSNLADGLYVFRAVATDDTGLTTTSAPVSVTILGAPALTSMVVTGSVWRYLDDGSDPGPSWVEPDFEDGEWSVGQAKFGTNDPAVTLIRVGPTGATTNLTTYFRHRFPVTNASRYTNLLFQVLRDDGVVVYLNGQEIFRMNMPAGPIRPFTPALSPVGGTNEWYYFPTNIPSGGLVEGTNLVAVELHQVVGFATWDAGFDLSLTGLAPPSGVLRLAIQREESDTWLDWTAAGASLQQADDLAGPWTDLDLMPAVPHFIPATNQARFFRLRRTP